MKLARRIHQVWNWLPAFRAVAESEHLPTASREANLSASALSRSVRLLEDDLGMELFVREGRQLELTAAGRTLLLATRTAMSTLEQALDRVLVSETTGPVHVAAPGPYGTLFVLPAFHALKETNPDISAYITSVDRAERSRALHDGAVDIVIDDDAEVDPHVRVTKLCELGYGVYVASDHVLARRDHVDVFELEKHPFVGPAEGIVDHWPPHRARQVKMVVQHLHVAMEVCATFGLCAVLPDLVARHYRGPGSLCRLPIDLVEPRPVYALSRHAAAEPRRVDLVLEAIVREVDDLVQRTTEYPPPIRSTMRPPPIPDVGT